MRFSSWVRPPAYGNSKPFTGMQGIQPGQIVVDAGTLAPLLFQEMVDIANTGATWIRMNFRLGAAYSSWTPQVLALYDQAVTMALSLNLDIVGLLSNEFWPGIQTDWCANNNEQLAGSGDNTYIQNFAAASGTVAAHFYPRIRDWEIWNEPDNWATNPSDAIYTGNSFIYPSNFCWLLWRVAQNIRPVGGFDRLNIITGGLFVNDLGATIGNFSYTYFIPNFLNYGIANIPGFIKSFDAIGEHIYINQGNATSGANIQAACDNIRNVYVPIIGGSYKTWITEIGWTTGSVTQAIQAGNLQTAYQTLQSLPYVVHSFWFKIFDDAGGFGLYDVNNNAKLSYLSYKAFANF